MNRRLLSSLVCSLLAITALAGCGELEESTKKVGERPPLEKLSLLLDFYPNANHAGIYQAKESGALAKAGIDLTVRPPQDPASVLSLLSSGKTDLAITYEPELLLARAKGADLIAIAAIAQTPLTSLMSLPSAKIKTAKDLKGKKVGTAGIPYQDAYLDTILESAGVDSKSVKRVNVGFNLNSALVSKKVDATLGGFSNYEGIQLELKKRKPVVVPVQDLGVPTYNELVLVAKPQTLVDHESGIRRLLRALSTGYREVQKNPDLGVAALGKVDKNLDPKLQLAAISQSASLYFPSDGDKPWGWMNTKLWADYIAWMAKQKLLSNQEISLESVISNDFLPGEGAGEGRRTPSGVGQNSQPLPGYRGE